LKVVYLRGPTAGQNTARHDVVVAMEKPGIETVFVYIQYLLKIQH